MCHKIRAIVIVTLPRTALEALELAMLNFAMFTFAVCQLNFSTMENAELVRSIKKYIPSIL